MSNIGDDHDYRIKDINLKPLPLAEGFWNSLPVIHNVLSAKCA
jgi:hypothetical protein